MRKCWHNCITAAIRYNRHRMYSSSTKSTNYSSSDNNIIASNSNITESLLKDFAIFKYNNEQEKLALDCLTEVEKNAILEQRLLSFASLPSNITRNDVAHYLSKMYIPRAAFALQHQQHHDHNMVPENYKTLAQHDLLFPHAHMHPQYDATGSFTGKFFLFFDDFYDAKHLLIRHERRKVENRKTSYNSFQSELLQVGTVDPVEYAMNKHFCMHTMGCVQYQDFAKCFVVWNPFKIELNEQVVRDALLGTAMQKCIPLQDYNYLVRFESEAEMYRAMRLVQFGKNIVPTMKSTRYGINK